MVSLINRLDHDMLSVGDRISAFVYDQWGWHLRVIVLWSYTFISTPFLRLVISENPIDAPIEVFEVGMCLVAGLLALWVFTRSPLRQINGVLGLLRADFVMKLIRLIQAVLVIVYGIGLLSAKGDPAVVVHYAHQVIVFYWACSIVPDRPRKKRFEFKLSPEPLPQGAS